uniref:heterogeneous nuclear ribonucleoprotein L-like isoform X2 n=1 Tax=Myxine glutinosa TaxID=7769 RepID=UPI00358FB6CB
MEQAEQDNSVEDPRRPPPSPVVHMRGLPTTVVESEVVDAMQHFGSVKHVVILPNRRQALVEFESLEEARNCVTSTSSDPVYVGGQPAYCNYSTSQKIARPSGSDDANVNNILLFTILNPLYPITTDVVYTICSPCGTVLRIVIFKKNGVQSLVEFDSVPNAQRAKTTLNGADIYSGCCTLKIEYAKSTRLNVYRNDSETWDFTIQGPVVQNGQRQRPPALLGDHPSTYRAYAGSAQTGYSMTYPPGTSYTPSSPSSIYNQTPTNGRLQPVPPTATIQQSPPAMLTHQSTTSIGHRVLMIYGLEPTRMNCDRLFNLLCLYGNIEKIKFLKSKPGAAMIQMADAAAVDRAVTHLNTAQLFDKKLNLAVSKQPEIMAGVAYELEDGTNSFKDFHGCRNNRFSSPEQAAKNRILPPSSVLHFYNAPPDFTEDSFNQICDEFDLEKPTSFRLFSGERSVSGLTEWASKTLATEALAVLNHYQMKSTGGPHTFTLKLCFSPAQQV